jgi:DNA-binding transcriptional ArsR family regulator
MKKSCASKYLHIYLQANTCIIMEIRRDVFQAIADPTRREIIGMLAQKPLNLNSIAERFDVSRQAVSLHVKILTECGLIVINKQGRERYCEAKLDKLSEVSDWVEQYRKFWTQQFKSLDKYLNKIQANKKSKK